MDTCLPFLAKGFPNPKRVLNRKRKERGARRSKPLALCGLSKGEARVPTNGYLNAWDKPGIACWRMGQARVETGLPPLKFRPSLS